AVKQAQIVRKASGYFVMLSLQADVAIPATMPHGHPVGIDAGLGYFLSTENWESSSTDCRPSSRLAL
ncbi:MAG: hypothetical protein Q6L68_11675, partial [Thermostichus sp. DG02_5_bins_236]